MEICKEAAVKGIGTPDREELALINALARRELGEDEVYTFALRLCDNDIDRDGERFDDGTLDTGVRGIRQNVVERAEPVRRRHRAGCRCGGIIREHHGDFEAGKQHLLRCGQRQQSV